MTKLVRRQIVVGEWYSVEYAVRADGSEPARDFLQALKGGVLPDDPLTTDIPDEEQITDYDRLVEVMREVARAGEPTRNNQLNYLEEGLWEFKHGNKRIAFFDTDEAGGHTPQGKCSMADSPAPESSYWWLPTLAPVLRVTNGWIKTDDLAPPADMALAKQIRLEDLPQ